MGYVGATWASEGPCRPCPRVRPPVKPRLPPCRRAESVRPRTRARSTRVLCRVSTGNVARSTFSIQTPPPSERAPANRTTGGICFRLEIVKTTDWNIQRGLLRGISEGFANACLPVSYVDSYETSWWNSTIDLRRRRRHPARNLAKLAWLSYRGTAETFPSIVILLVRVLVVCFRPLDATGVYIRM